MFSPLGGRLTTWRRQVCTQYDRHTAAQKVNCRGPRLDILQLCVEESVQDVPMIACACIQSVFFDRESVTRTVSSCMLDLQHFARVFAVGRTVLYCCTCSSCGRVGSIAWSSMANVDHSSHKQDLRRGRYRRDKNGRRMCRHHSLACIPHAIGDDQITKLDDSCRHARDGHHTHKDDSRGVAGHGTSHGLEHHLLEAFLHDPLRSSFSKHVSEPEHKRDTQDCPQK